MKLTDKQRTMASVNFMMRNHVIDLDEAHALVTAVESEADISEAEIMLSILEDYQAYLEAELEEACPDEN